MPYTSSYDLAQPCVFAKQSPGPFHCALTCVRGPFSRSYRAILPSSLARSEEHTSELQSLMRISYAVFCLKKKNYTLYFAEYPKTLTFEPQHAQCSDTLTNTVQLVSY